MNLSPAQSNHQSLQILYGPEVRQVFMGIYNNFLLTSGESRQNSLMVCAASRGEGATTVALGLAIAAAEVQNQPVLLIDGNFSHPLVCGAFGMRELYGFGDFLADRIDVKSAARNTSIPNLQVMGAGVAPLNHVSTLESSAFRDRLDRLAEVYSLIIIDGPPVNLYPESVLYAAHVKRVFLTVYSGVTRVQVVAAALAKLTAGGCDRVELILNRRTFPIPGWFYKRL